MKDQISALLDGELDEVEAARLIERLKQPELRRTWDEYHRIGDALRGHFARDISAEVAAHLVAEPTVLAPGARARSASHVGTWALSVAASFAAIALVAWVAFPMYGPAPQAPQVAQIASVKTAPQQPAQSVPATSLSGAQLASRPGTPRSGPILSAREQAEADARAQAEALSALGVGNYLLAHQRYSPSSAMQGVAPYVRSVSSGGYER